MKDRLGRGLGQITKPENSQTFQIKPEPEGLLKAVPTMHPTLQDAMLAIAKLTNGTCTLDSQDWISRGSEGGDRGQPG